MSSESGRGSRQFFTPPPQMMLQRSHLTEHSLPLYHPNHYYSREFLHPYDISWRRRDHYTRKDRPQFLTPQPQLIRSNTDLGDMSVVSDRGFPYQSNTIYDTADDYSYLVRRPQRPARGDYHHPSQMPSFDINDSHITNDIDDDTVISSVSEHINRNKREHLNSRKSQSPEPGLENSALNGLRYRGHNYVRNESRPYVDAGALDHMYMECPLENPIGKTSISKGPFWNNNDLNIDDEVVRVGRICGSDIRPGVEILGKPIRDEVQPVQEVHSLNVENIASIRKRQCYVDMVPLTPSACSKYYSQNNTSQPLTKENVERHDKMVNLTPEDEQVSNSTASLDLPDGEMDYIGVDQRIHQSMKENSSCGSKHSDPDQLSLTVPRGDSIERNSSLKEASAQHGILTNFDIENPGGNDGVTEEKDNMSTIKSLYNIEPIDVNLQVQNEEEVTDKTLLAEESEKDNSDTDNKVCDNMEAVEEEEADVETAQYDNSPQKLYNWIIKMVPQVKGVCVEGKRQMDDEHYWETGVVIKRHSHVIVENKSGHQYRLMGDIDMEDVDCGGFDNKTITKFVNGFPDDWMKIIANFYKSKDQTQKSDSDVKGKGSLKVNKETKCNKKQKLKNEGKENKKQKTDKSTKLKEQQIVKQHQKSSVKITQEPKGNKNLVKDNKKSQNIVKQKAIDLVPKETQRTLNTQKKTCILKEWIIKPLSHCQGICVEGKLSNLEKDEFWHSSPILERINSRTLLSTSGTCYKLVGSIERLEALEHGFNSSVVKAFKNGFPGNWKQIVAKHFLLRRGKSDITDSPVAIEMTENHQFFTPVGHKVQLDQVQRTKSGRVVKPMVGWWMGQRLQIDQDTGEYKLKCLTDHALKVSSQMSLQYLAVQRKSENKGNRSMNNSNVTVTEKDNRIPLLHNAECDDDFTRKKSSNKRKESEKENNNTQRNGVKYKGEIELEKEVLIVLNESKKRRSSNKPNRNTCYKSEQSVDNTSVDKSRVYNIEDSEDDNDEPRTRSKVRRTHSKGTNKDSKSKTSDVQDSVMKEERPSRRSTRNLSKNVCYTENDWSQERDLERRGKERNQKATKRERSTSRSKSRHSKATGNCSYEKEKEQNHVEKGNKNGQKRKCGESNISSDGNVQKDSEGVLCHEKWKTDEIIRFTKILKVLEPDDVGFWDKICSAVKTRSVTECQEYYYRDVPQHQKKLLQRKAKSKNNKEKHEVKELTAKAGTLKRKQQLRDIVENAAENYTDDLFDSTPFRKYGSARSAGKNQNDDDDVFAELAAQNEHFRNKIFTPLTRLDIRPASTAKTPASQLQIDTPVYDRKKIDQYTRLANLKRRRLVNQTKRLKTPLHKPKKVGAGSHVKAKRSKKSQDLQSLFVTDYNSDHNHVDSDQEDDFYFSDH